jgi:hypothetical protein
MTNGERCSGGTRTSAASEIALKSLKGVSKGSGTMGSIAWASLCRPCQMSLTFLQNLCFREVLMSLKDAPGEKTRVKWIHMSNTMTKPTTLS